MTTFFHWPPTLANGQLYQYNNIFSCLYLFTLLMAVMTAVAAYKKQPRCFAFMAMGVSSLYIRHWVSRIIPNPTNAFQFLLFFTTDWVLYWILLFLFKKFQYSRFHQKLNPTLCFFCRALICSGIASWCILRMFANQTLAVFISIGVFGLSAANRNVKWLANPKFPHWTYVDLLEQTGTPWQKKPRSKAYPIVMYFVSLYLAWRFLFTLPFNAQSTFAMVLAIIMLVTECMAILEFLHHIATISQNFNFPVPKVSSHEEWPDVDVFIATYNEDEDLLFKTVNGCLHMTYPDPQKVHIYLCDDGRRENIRHLAERMQIGYIIREDNQGAKAGNLNNALKHTTSPLVVTFDADMIPRSHFLMETIPYFIDARRRNRQLLAQGKSPIPLGFLQTPQSFYNQDLFQYHLYSETQMANEQDYFYREIQPSRTLSNSVIYGGSNTILSREALNSVGGFFTKAITEDFATGILIEGNGYVSIGTSQPLAFGLSAEDFPSLIQQRKRWGRGVINVLYQINLFFTRRYSTAQKISYWSSIQYWLSPFMRAVFSFTPVISALMGVAIVNCSIEQSLIFWVPYALAQTFMLSHVTHNLRSSFWTIVYDTILAPFLFFPILNELLGISLKTFKVTLKGQSSDKHNQLRYIWPFAITLILNIAAAFISIRNIVVDQAFGMAITLFWILNNLSINLIALLFVADTKSGSPAMMNREYMSVTVAPSMSTQTIRNGVVTEISEDHMNIVFKNPWNIDPGTKVTVNLTFENKTIQVTGIVDGVFHKNGLKVVELYKLQSNEPEEFLTLVHDRDLTPYSGNTGPVVSVALVKILKNRFSKRKDARRQAKEKEASIRRLNRPKRAARLHEDEWHVK
ncbi:glycosyltransferase [Erysipelotrichaceae bacterium RD49]|nr:glycosyltransferase [Erysipelotrichaceae bacterium RD49]